VVICAICGFFLPPDYFLPFHRQKWSPANHSKTGRYRKAIRVGIKIPDMPKYVIEREIPGAGALTADQLKGISQTSCGVLSNMGPQIQWVHSYVTGNKIYCVYNAPNEEMVREHAKQGGFPANSVSKVSTIIDPTTAE
jgi:hypothetical protein